ncbi:MAG TPA: HNH endonuclease, partial [Kofleriaceae bacterium]|nr:HNH endonuclease [Kofleriaceae bacterium]
AGAPAPATQTIPPRIRRLVWRRDHGRCQVPGCRAAKFLEVHHVRWRSDGGGHDPLNLAVTCSIHHDLVHRGLIVVEGSAPALIFRHADGRPYGQLQADDAHLIAGLRGAGAPTAEPQRPPVPGAASGAPTAEPQRPPVPGAGSGAPTAEPQRPLVPGAASGAATAEPRRPLVGDAISGIGRSPDHVSRQADGRPCRQARAHDVDVADAIAGLRRIGVPAPDAQRAVAEAAASGAVAIEDLLRQALIVLGRTTYASRMTWVESRSATP